jgi:hypothetical protein
VIGSAAPLRGLAQDRYTAILTQDFCDPLRRVLICGMLALWVCAIS